MDKYHSLRKRFWDKVQKGDGCWEWREGKNSWGYGQTSYHGNGKQIFVGAHRVAYELTHGEIGEGMSICHHCDNPACCRPDHLFVGSQKDNMVDKMKKGRQTPKRGVSHQNSKLNESQVARTRILVGAFSQYRIAEMFGVSRSAIAAIVQGNNWTHLSPYKPGWYGL